MTIVELDLYENYIGPSGAKAIANMLKENCYLASLVRITIIFYVLLDNKILTSSLSCI